MAYVVAKKPGRFEVRESENTAKGPRSRTLISFEELTDEAIEKARRRATKPFAPDDLRKAARRAGATVARPPLDRAARELIAGLAKGRSLDPTLRQILVDLLEKGYREGADPSPANGAAQDVAEWMAATPAERGRALVDLLLLADALPSGGRRDKPLEFPRLDSHDG
jgi:hypothetical protein